MRPLMLGLVLGLLPGALAQQSVRVLELAPAGDLRVAGVEGRTGAEPHRFLVEGLSVLRPVDLALVGAGLVLRVYKYRFEEPLREVAADASGRAWLGLRTEGDLRLEVAGPPGVPYRLVVAAGPETPPPLPVRFVAGEAPTGRSWLLPALLGVVLLGGVFYGLRRLLFVLPLVLLPAAAQVAPLNPATALKWLDEVKAHVDRAAKAGKMTRSYEALTRVDREILSPAVRGPELPLSCREDRGCYACYRPAIGRFREAVANLERARAIYLATKAFTDDAIAFGDAMAGIPGAGLGWPKERAGIRRAFEAFKEKYERKVRELADRAEAALREIGRCEARFGGGRDWFERYGALYRDLVRARYLP